ncbi:hypothetical protein AVEN_208348-1 [Araneus ventricosus]|uniref:Uncharacterized protein n=1 Tax=Araneus ventricosus TaxID=182803 RepID=A0A4Y2FCA9_ARAVE|nr:hypothetical protein AVEN_208348-1 [Araneus ventricosus]
MENSIADGKTWISSQTYFQAFLHLFFMWDPDAMVAADQTFTRLGFRSEATFIGNTLSGGNRGDRGAAVEGERRLLSPTANAFRSFR